FRLRIDAEFPYFFTAPALIGMVGNFVLLKAAVFIVNKGVDGTLRIFVQTKAVHIIQRGGNITDTLYLTGLRVNAEQGNTLAIALAGSGNIHRLSAEGKALTDI